MAITAAQIEALVTAGNTALDGGDYGVAVSKYRQAKAFLSALPDSLKDGNELSFDRAALDTLIADTQKLANAAANSSSVSTSATAGAGFSVTKLRHVNDNDDGNLY